MSALPTVSPPSFAAPAVPIPWAISPPISSDKSSAGLQTPAASAHIARALHYIEVHLSDADLKVNRVAEALNLDPAYLSHLFSIDVGVRMAALISSRRMSLAATLLTSGRCSVKAVAFQVGYTNADAFSQAFRAHTGLSPTDFRHRDRLEHPENSLVNL